MFEIENTLSVVGVPNTLEKLSQQDNVLIYSTSLTEDPWLLLVCYHRAVEQSRPTSENGFEIIDRRAFYCLYNGSPFTRKKVHGGMWWVEGPACQQRRIAHWFNEFEYFYFNDFNQKQFRSDET